MPNPKAPTRTVVTSEVEAPKDYMVRRLRKLGATDDEVAAFAKGWDDFGDDWTPELRARFVSLSDADVHRMIAEARDEYHDHTTDEDDDAAEAAKADADRLLGEAGLVLERAANVGEVLGWVGENRARAEAVLALEVGGRDRKTLVGPLRALVD